MISVSSTIFILVEKFSLGNIWKTFWKRNCLSFKVFFFHLVVSSADSDESWNCPGFPVFCPLSRTKNASHPTHATECLIEGTWNRGKTAGGNSYSYPNPLRPSHRIWLRPSGGLLALISKISFLQKNGTIHRYCGVLQATKRLPTRVNDIGGDTFNLHVWGVSHSPTFSSIYSSSRSE